MFSEFYSQDEKTFRNLSPRICNDNKHWYVGSSTNESLYQPTKTNKLKLINLEKCNKTIFESEFDTNRFDDIKYSVDFSLKNGEYEKVIYDPYRKLFYQIASHSTNEIVKWDNPYFNTTDLKEFSIQIYDKDFNFISETVFPKGLYQINAIIPVPEGILIDTGNENNPNFKTSILSYHLFKLI